jgi:hypothetical protein
VEPAKYESKAEHTDVGESLGEDEALNRKNSSENAFKKFVVWSQYWVIESRG